ncbi:MAG: flagellar brake protein [Lachnospiraceae bacterium]|nr:flagellar brake protein [Lachnospiraceae bacterium]
MLSKYVLPGSRVELQEVNRDRIGSEEEKKRVYTTQVRDIFSDERIEILMPIEHNKVVLLPVGAEFDLYFYTPNGLYQCFASVIDRYKDGTQYAILMERTSNLRKFQRREYYRLSCALEMSARPLEEEEISSLEKNGNLLVPGLPLKSSVVVDISGGGLRFISSYAYEPDSLIYCKYKLIQGGNAKEYTLVAKILTVQEMDNRPGVYEHRAQYVNMDSGDREEIIKFIFDEERMHRKRERGF